jgi:hypothetical protein
LFNVQAPTIDATSVSPPPRAPITAPEASKAIDKIAASKVLISALLDCEGLHDCAAPSTHPMDGRH